MHPPQDLGNRTRPQPGKGGGGECPERDERMEERDVDMEAAGGDAGVVAAIRTPGNTGGMHRRDLLTWGTCMFRHRSRSAAEHNGATVFPLLL